MDPNHYKKFVENLFDGAAPLYGKDGVSYFHYFGENLVNLASPKPEMHILDVATGTGAILCKAAEKIGPKGLAIGIDISPQMIAQSQKACSELGSKNIQLQVMDAEQLNFPEGTFDMVFCGFGLFFMPNVDKALSECRRVLKKEGVLAVSIWGPRDYSYILLRELIASYPINTTVVAHNFEETESVISLLKKAKFHDITIEEDTLDFVYPSIDAWWDSLWGHGTRVLLEQLSKDEQYELLQSLKEKLTPHVKHDGLHNMFKAYYFLSKK